MRLLAWAVKLAAIGVGLWIIGSQLRLLLPMFDAPRRALERIL